MKYEVRVKPCFFPCEICGRVVPPGGASNFLYETGHHLEVFCLPCIQFQISEDNRVMGEQRFELVIEGEASAKEQNFGTPLAPRSEHRPGEVVHYQTGDQLQAGEVLHVTDGEGGGQFYIVENAKQGFPDVVRANEIVE